MTCVVIGPQGRVLEAVPYDGRLRHFQQGPADLIRERGTPTVFRFNLAYAAAAASETEFKRRTSELLFDPAKTGDFSRWQREGMTYTVTQDGGGGGWLFRWWFRGGGEATAIRQALEDPQGWAAAGIAIRQTVDRSAAHCEIEIVQSIPDYPQAAGLYRWGQGGTPEILFIERYLADAAFAEHLVNHEAGHAIIRAYDMVPERGFPYYSGIMDYTGTETWPIDREIEDAKRWLSGQGVVQ